MKKILFTLLFIGFITNSNAQVPSYVPTDGLVAYYPFNGNANDETGNGNNGAVNGATLTSDRDGNIESAYNFDESSWIETSETFSTSAQNASVCAWFYCNIDISSMTAQIISINTSTSEHSLQLEISANNALYFNALPYDQTITPVNTFEYDSWNFVVGTFDGTTETIYVNGQKVTEKNRTGDFSIINQKINFGRQTFPTADYWYGKIDDVGVWNRALTEQEIQNLYSSSTGEILLNGIVSAQNNQIKNIADPTDAQDAATMSYVDSAIGNNSPTIEDVLTAGNDANGIQLKGLQDPTEAQDAVTLSVLLEKVSELQDQISALQATTGSGTVTDQDDNSYDYLTYGDQAWTVDNAEMVTYRDGTPIPQFTGATEWSNLTTGAWAYYNNDPTKHRLYNWYAVMGIHDTDPNTPNKEFAPEGWHVPTDAEWTTLENYLIANGYNYDGTTTENKIAKAMASTTGWNSSTELGAIGNDQSLNNNSGFNAFPGGNRSIDGLFEGEGSGALFWSSTEFDSDNPFYWGIFSNGSGAGIGYGESKQYGFSVRFVRD